MCSNLKKLILDVKSSESGKYIDNPFAARSVIGCRRKAIGPSEGVELSQVIYQIPTPTPLVNDYAIALHKLITFQLEVITQVWIFVKIEP